MVTHFITSFLQIDVDIIFVFSISASSHPFSPYILHRFQLDSIPKLPFIWVEILINWNASGQSTPHFSHFHASESYTLISRSNSIFRHPSSRLINHYHDHLGDRASSITHILLAGYKSGDEHIINSFFIWMFPGTRIPKCAVKFQSSPSIYHDAWPCVSSKSFKGSTSGYLVDILFIEKLFLWRSRRGAESQSYDLDALSKLSITTFDDVNTLPKNSTNSTGMASYNLY